MRRLGSRPTLRYNCLGVLIMAAPAGSVKPDEYVFKCSAALPADGDNGYRLLFYNIGWDVTSKKHTMEGLATEVCSMVNSKCLDGVGIYEDFNLKDDRRQQRQDIMQHLLSKINTSAARPATCLVSNAAQPLWTGRSDGHYIFIWNSSRLTIPTETSRAK